MCRREKVSENERMYPIMGRTKKEQREVIRSDASVANLMIRLIFTFMPDISELF